MELASRLNRVFRRVPPWTIYLCGFGWSVWLLWQAASGAMGADPVKGLEHALGKLGLQLLVAVLCITPLRKLTGVSLIRFRRALGLTAFFYIVLHFLVWVALDMGMLLSLAAADIVKRPYVTVGMAGLLLIIPLAITSNDRMIRRLGPVRWRRLHLLTYPAVLLGAVHYLWLVKSWPPEPILYLLAVVGLLGLRFPIHGPSRTAMPADSGVGIAIPQKNERLT